MKNLIKNVIGLFTGSSNPQVPEPAQVADNYVAVSIMPVTTKGIVYIDMGVKGDESYRQTALICLNNLATWLEFYGGGKLQDISEETKKGMKGYSFQYTYRIVVRSDQLENDGSNAVDRITYAVRTNLQAIEFQIY